MKFGYDECDSPFERALSNTRLREPNRGAIVDVAETTAYAWKAACTIFGDKADPSHAISLAEMMLVVMGRLPPQPHRPPNNADNPSG